MAVYEALVQLDEAGNPQPGLAQSWKYSADLTVFTMKLRPNVTFHDGTKFDAAAVGSNLDRSAALGNPRRRCNIGDMSPDQLGGDRGRQHGPASG